MSEPAVADYNEFANRYMAVWNEPDADVRRKSIAQLWTEDATHFTQAREEHGHEAIEARITRAQEQYVKTGGYVFTLSNDVKSHHNVVLLTWQMTPPGGDKVAAVGSVFVFLSDDGRIWRDYQFTQMLP